MRTKLLPITIFAYVKFNNNFVTFLQVTKKNSFGNNNVVCTNSYGKQKQFAFPSQNKVPTFFKSYSNQVSIVFFSGSQRGLRLWTDARCWFGKTKSKTRRYLLKLLPLNHSLIAQNCQLFHILHIVVTLITYVMDFLTEQSLHLGNLLFLRVDVSSISIMIK